MFFRTIVSLLILITPSNILFSMSKGNKTALSNIKKIELIDKDYRTIAVLPFGNLTGNDYYSYVGKTIQKFLSNNLSVLDKIEINTNDFLIPEKFRTNEHIIFSYGTNLLRKVIILNPDTVYKKYIKSRNPDDLKTFSQGLNADYTISGSYKFNKKSRNIFEVSYNIFNVIRKKKVYHNQEILDHNEIEKGIKNISTDIMDYFHPEDTGVIRIVTDFSNYELFIDDQLIQNKINLYNQTTGKHRIKLHPVGYRPIETNIILQAEKTNTLTFQKKYYFIKKASLIISTNPTNASIYLNVKHIGNTPLIYTNLQTGNYRLKVIKSNYSTYFQNIELKKGTNQFLFSLKKIRTKTYYEEKHKRNRIIMYTTLGTGALFMLNTYFFYAAQDTEYEKHKNESDARLSQKYYQNYRKYDLIWKISAIAGLGNLAISLIYFFKVLNYDDTNIGLINENSNTNFAFKNNTYFLSLKYKFQ